MDWFSSVSPFRCLVVWNERRMSCVRVSSSTWKVSKKQFVFMHWKKRFLLSLLLVCDLWSCISCYKHCNDLIAKHELASQMIHIWPLFTWTAAIPDGTNSQTWMQKVVTLYPQQSNTYLAYFVKVTFWKISWKGYNRHSWQLTISSWCYSQPCNYFCWGPVIV